MALAPAAGGDFVDAILGEAEGRILTAADVALARALSLFGFTPVDGVIAPSDVDRMLDAWLVAAEAERLGIGAAADEIDAAWRAAAARLGGAESLQTWLAHVAVEPVRARHLVADDQRWRRFIQLRFRDFAFVTPGDVEAALGPGTHTAEAEAQMRARLREAETQRRLAAWLDERRQRARRLPPATQALSNPFPMP